MSDSPVSDQAPEDLRSDTTKKKSAGTHYRLPDRPDRHTGTLQSPSLCLHSVITVYTTRYSPVQMCLKPRGLTNLAGKLVMFGIKILLLEVQLEFCKVQTDQMTIIIINYDPRNTSTTLSVKLL